MPGGRESVDRGLGNRVIERINKPLQEVLLSDGEDALDNSIFEEDGEHSDVSFSSLASSGNESGVLAVKNGKLKLRRRRKKVNRDGRDRRAGLKDSIDGNCGNIAMDRGMCEPDATSTPRKEQPKVETATDDLISCKQTSENLPSNKNVEERVNVEKVTNCNVVSSEVALNKPAKDLNSIETAENHSKETLAGTYERFQSEPESCQLSEAIIEYEEQILKTEVREMMVSHENLQKDLTAKTKEASKSEVGSSNGQEMFSGVIERNPSDHATFELPVDDILEQIEQQVCVVQREELTLVQPAPTATDNHHLRNDDILKGGQNINVGQIQDETSKQEQICVTERRKEVSTGSDPENMKEKVDKYVEELVSSAFSYVKRTSIEEENATNQTEGQVKQSESETLRATKETEKYVGKICETETVIASEEQFDDWKFIDDDMSPEEKGKATVAFGKNQDSVKATNEMITNSSQDVMNEATKSSEAEKHSMEKVQENSRSLDLTTVESVQQDSPDVAAVKSVLQDSPDGTTVESVQQNSPDVASNEDCLLETYDSDLDVEDLKILPEVILCAIPEIRKLKAKDSPGYIYAFMDKLERIKIGASRQPYKKLEQARRFNVDIQLVSAVEVSQRKAALTNVRHVLLEYSFQGHEDWFVGPLDKILETFMGVAKKYPLDK